MPFGQPVQTGLAARPATPNRMMPQQNRMRQAIGGVNRAQLGAGGPRQGLSPSYARPLINTPPAGPPEQGYGRPAMPSPPSAPKLQPTGGVQMGARNQVGLTGPMNNQAATYGGLNRIGLGPSSEMMAQPPQEGIQRGYIPNIPNITPLPMVSDEEQMMRDQSALAQAGKVPPPGGYDMGAVSDVGMNSYTPSPDSGFRSMQEVAPRMMDTSVRDQLMANTGGGLGPSRRIFGMR